MTDIKIKSAIDEQDIKEVRIAPKQTTAETRLFQTQLCLL
jgi:hypothetical protein